VTIAIRILQPGGQVQPMTIDVDPADVVVVGSTAYAPAWTGHNAELDLSRPDLGWTVFPD